VPGNGLETVTFSPLAGVRVVDLTSSLAGPYCTAILGALGADVVKVEHPERGDEARAWGPDFFRGGSVLFFAANAGKRSLALDVKAPQGRAALLRLVERADVFVQSLRPGTAERLGLGARALTTRNDRLVYCSISAYGRDGPLRDLAGYDPLMQAAGGIVSVTGEPDRPGVRAGASLVDQSTGMWAALGVVAALHDRERTGRGGAVDVSLYEAALALLPYHIAQYIGTGEEPGRHGTAFPLIVPYQSFTTADGELMVAAGNDRLFAALCRALDLSDVADDERFATNPLRVSNRDELVSRLAARFRREPTRTWLERLTAAGVPAAPVQTVAEVAAHEQTRALGILQELDGRTAVAPPLSVGRERLRFRAAPPALGEHSAEVLAEAGYSEAEIAELLAAGVVRFGNGPAR
jgi:crotonobetainyl-CoA:carnitine CoA-transferase CaiB-like acyl-CoA transferase